MSAQLDFAAGDDYYDTSVLSIPDRYEAVKMSPFQPGTQDGTSWWQSALQYGIVRAIDNKFATPVNTVGNVQAGSFSGANGRTYMNNGSAQPAAGLGISNDMLMLAAIGVLAFLALR